MSDTAIAGLGDNKPPLPTEKPTIKSDLEQRYSELFERLKALLKKLGEVPDTIDDDDTAGKVGDLLKAVRVCLGNVDSTRKIENEEYRRIVAEVNATFQKPAEELKTKRDEVQERRDDYLKRKADEAKRIEEEKAEKARKEAAEKAEKAAQAERDRLAAEKAAKEAAEREAAAKRQAEEAEARRVAEEARAKAAKEAADKAERERKEREEAERKARTEDLKTATDMLQQAQDLSVKEGRTDLETDRLHGMVAAYGQIAALLARVMGAAELLGAAMTERCKQRFEHLYELRKEVLAQISARDEAREAERHRIAEEQRKKEEREAAERAEERRQAKEREDQARAEADRAKAAAAAAKEEARTAKAEAKDARDEGRAASAEARSAGRDERRNMDEAGRLDDKAAKHEAKAEGPASSLARTRGDYGSVGTLAEVWKYEVLDRDAIDLEKLRLFIHPDAIDSAIWKFIQAGHRDLKGVRIFEDLAGRTI